MIIPHFSKRGRTLLTKEFKKILGRVVTAALSLGVLSCARPAQTVKASSAQSEAAADTALGTLPPPGQTETEKKAAELEAQYTKEDTLEDIQKKQLEEEQKRTQRSITEDQIQRQIEK